MVGVNAFRTYVDGWYDNRFQNVVYAPNRAPEISRMISAILAGYAWDTANPFVEKSEQRLNTLAELVGNFAKVSKGEEILQTAVPLIEQIDELFFGKLDNNEEQFKHFLVRLNKE